MSDKIKLITREQSAFYLQKNLGALDPEYIKKKKEAIEAGKDADAIEPANPLIHLLAQTKEKIIPIDNEIVIGGVKNPLVTCFIGFSTRKLYDAMVRKKKRVDNVIFIEPDLGVFKHLLLTEDISDLLVNARYEFIIGFQPEILLDKLFKVFSVHDPGSPYSRMTKLQNMERIRDPFTLKGNEEVYDRIDTTITESVQHVQLSMGCADDQFRRWEMMFENKDVMSKSWNISPLYNRFKDVPVIVCGGGPSLDGFLEYAKKDPNITDKAVIIAVDAVANRLIEANIKPHMVVRCERKLTNIFKGLTKEKTKGIHYVAYPWTSKEFFNLFDDIFYVFRANGICASTELPHGMVNGGVSSGNAGLELALLLGSENIILTGIDMVEVDGKTHTSGTQVEFNIEGSKKKGMIKVKCNDGVIRETIKVWYRCFNEYYQSISKHSAKRPNEFKVYNTSEKGIEIPSATYTTWDKLSDILKNKTNVVKRIDRYKKKLDPKDIKKFNDNNKKVYEMLKEIDTDLSTVENLRVEAKRTCDRECEKLVSMLVSEFGGFTLVQELRKQSPNFEKLHSALAENYDINFKNKWLRNTAFRLIFLDILQLDTYHYENQVNSLINLFTDNDSKFKRYAELTKGWLKKIEYYNKEMLRIVGASLNDSN